MKKIIAVIGPTAIGKSDLAINLAKYFNGEIINGDSIQVYKELNIGSAKTLNDKGVKHHLIDYKNVEENYDVAQFQNDARLVIDDIVSRGKLPIVCGGTGLYVKALLYDYNFPKQDISKVDYDLFTDDQLYEKLKAIDPISCEKIHKNNRKRVIRALQIAESGENKSEREAQQQHICLYDCKLIGLTIEREKLKARIDKRVETMIKQGLEKEVIDLFDKYSTNYHCFSAIGYKEFIDYYNGKQSLEKTIELIKTHTKQFAKRQYTWFNNQMNVDWYDIDNKDYQQKIISSVEDFLNE